MADIPHREVGPQSRRNRAAIVESECKRGLARRSCEALLGRQAEQAAGQRHCFARRGQRRRAGIAVRCNGDWHALFA